MIVWILSATVIVLLILLLLSYSSNSKLRKENQLLREITKTKDKTVENLQASRVAVKEVIENLSNHEEVMALVEAGETIPDIAQKMGIPENKIELIIKFDKIKKDHAAS
jgi:cell division protein FtsB